MTVPFIGRALIEDRVHRADLEAEGISVGATLFFLVPVQRFKANVETLSCLPDKVEAGVVCLVVRAGFL